MKDEVMLIRISIGPSFSGVAGQLEDKSLEVVCWVAIVVVGSVHVVHGVTIGSVHHGFSISRSLAIVISVVHVPHRPVLTVVHGHAVTMGVAIAIGAVKGISISLSSCKGSKAGLEM